MKKYGFIFSVITVGFFYLQSYAAIADDFQAVSDRISSKKSVTRSIGVDSKILTSITETAKDISSKQYVAGSPKFIDPISSYESPVPHKSKPVISEPERSILGYYLDNPTDLKAIQYLAFFHLEQSLLNKNETNKAEALTHSIIALYFLNRAQDLGINSQWIKSGIKKLSMNIDKVTKKPKNVAVSIEENHEAHAYFLDAFNYHEENRYIAETKLVEDFINHNNNLHSAHLVESVYLWNAGESDYGDPTILYKFVLGGYFSTIVLADAQELEAAWKKDPAKVQRYRMTNLLGGFTTLYRGWLASLHQDQKAVDLINGEHKEWLKIQDIFHAMTYALSVYDDPSRFEGALAAMEEGTHACMVDAPPRTCWDHARLSFNVEGFALNKVDLLLKAGRVNDAMYWMHVIKNVFPNFAYWELGKDPYQHRLDNIQAIVARYQNNDPSDDPLIYSVKKQKWGHSTMICQGCHQAQGKVWSQAEKDLIIPPTEKYAAVNNWPKVTTEWYGTVKQKK